jgi:hypothetical protein
MRFMVFLSLNFTMAGHHPANQGNKRCFSGSGWAGQARPW